MPDVVYQYVFALASSNQVLATWRVTQASDKPTVDIIVSWNSWVIATASLKILFAVEHSHNLRLGNIPNINLAFKGADSDTFSVWAANQCCDFRTLVETISIVSFCIEIMDADGSIPTAAYEPLANKRYTAYGSLMTCKNLEHISSLQIPTIDFVGIEWSGTHNFSTRLHGQAVKLAFLVWLHRSKTLILSRIICFDSSIKTARYQRILIWEVHICHLTLVFLKSCETEPTFPIP